MRTDTIARKIERPCSFDQFLQSLSHQPAVASPSIPHTLRDHVGARQFGDFGAVLMAERPASADLSARVQRWRTINATAREDLPLRAHPDQAAEDRQFNFIFVVTPIVIMSWIIISLVAAWFKGAL